MKNSLISIGIMFFFLIALNIGNNATSAYASPATTQPTVTEVFPDRLEAHTFDAIYFTIHVSSNGNPVPSGEVHLYEVTTPSTTKIGQIIDGVVVIEYIVIPGLPSGWQTFVAEYIGTVDYDPSSGTTEVSLSDPQGTGVWETETIITPSLIQAGANDNITFTVDVTILGGAFPFFSGGYIALIDLTENIILDRHDIGMSPVLTYSVNFDFSVPNWYTTGIHTIEARYSGSYDADHAPSSDSCQIQLVINGNFIEFTSNASEVNRENEVLQLEASILGDDPTGQTLILQAFQNNGSIQMILEEITLTSAQYSYTFAPSYNHQLGPIEFGIILRNNVTGDIIAEANLSATIYDTVKYIHEFDQSSYADGDTVSLSVFAVEADLPTHPVMGEITVNDINHGITLTQSVNQYGRADFSWLIPINSSGGTHNVLISISPSETYHHGTVTSTSFDVYGNIQFVAQYPTNGKRGTQISLECTLLSNNGTIINEGTLSLKDSGNNIIWSTTVSGITQYQYSIGQNAAIGPKMFVWEYSGTEHFQAGSFSFSVIILSAPHFNALTLNKSIVVEGETVKISGQLVDEIGQGVSSVKVTIWDSSTFIGTVTTQIDGNFIYNYIIPTGASLGIHVIESHFDGNYSVYRLPSNNIGSVILTVNAPIELNITNVPVAGEITPIQVSGGPGEEITLSWCTRQNQSLWYSIGSIILDQNGKGTWNWIVPQYKGNITVRGKNNANYADYIDTSIYTKSQVSINNLISEAIVNQAFSMQITVSEEYRILLNGNSIIDWRSAGLHELNLSLPTRGIHVLKIETRGNFVIEETFTYEIIAYEPIVITMNVPTTISTTEEISANVHVAGLYTGNINAITVKILASGTERATGTTVSTGNVILSFSLPPGTYVLVCQVNGENRYYQYGENSATIVVRSGTNLTMPIGELYYFDTYSLSTTLKDDQGNPVAGESIVFAISIDQGNSWVTLGKSITNSIGIAQYDWFIVLEPGNYLIKASFNGSFYYDSSSKSKGISIMANDIQILWDDLLGTYGTSIQLNGYITTISGEPLNTSLHLSVSVYYNNQWILLDEIDSTENGIIGLLINLSFNPGTYPIQISFNGNTCFNAHISAKNLIINQIETQIITNQSSYGTTYGTIENISTSVTTISGDPIQSGILTYLIIDGNETVLSFTEPIINGQATLGLPIEQLTTGNYLLEISWPGTVTEAGTSTVINLTVNKGIAQLDATITESTINYGDTTIWYADVTNSLGNPVSNIPINFASSKTGFYWDDWGTVLTNESGYATIEIVWTVENQNHYGSPGTYTIRITIENNERVNTKQTTRMITVEKMNVVLNLNDVSILRLETAQFSGTLTSESGDPIANAIITLSWDGTATGNWETLGTLMTDENGFFILAHNITIIPENYNLYAEFNGDIYHYTTSQYAIVEVLDNTSILHEIVISDTVINLGDQWSSTVNVTDLDQIASVTGIIYKDSLRFNIVFNYVNKTYQTSIVCGAEYELGIWYIDIVITDNLGINTTFTQVTQIEISDNPKPIVSYALSSTSIIDGDSIGFEINASDTLGIYEVTIEIEGQTYPITTENENVYTFNYTPQGTGIIQFTLIVEDYGGQQTVVTANFEVQAVAPELVVVSMSPLNGTAPYPFFLNIDAMDNSGVNSIVLYANDKLSSLQYNELTMQWELNTIFSAENYSLTVIAIDNAGVEKSLELGTLNVSNPEIKVSNTEVGLGDTLTVEITGINPEVIASAKLIISNAEYFQEYTITNISTIISIDIHLNENYVLGTYSVILELKEFNENKTIYDNGIQFLIYTNSNPYLNAIFENQILVDGEATNFTIEATDTLGIESIVIIRGTETISLSLNENGIVTGEIKFDEAGTYMIQVVARDNAGAQTQKTFIFTVNAEGPEFVNVYPTQTMLAGLHTPFTLDIEALVIDASGVANVTLYVNGTEYPLVNTFGVWYTSVDLTDATYTMKLVAVDIYGNESMYDLGTVTPQENKIPDRPDSTDNSSDPGPTIPNVKPEIDSTAIIMGFTLLTLIGSSVLNWKRKG